jgi:hypothetical protein
MLNVERKYQARVMSNEWNTLTSEQEQIIALNLQIASINSFKLKKVSSTKHKKTNKKSGTAVQQRAKLFGSHAWRNRNPYLMNPILKLFTDQLGISILIIKHGEDIQPKVVSKQSPKDTELTRKCQPLILTSI